MNKTDPLETAPLSEEEIHAFWKSQGITDLYAASETIEALLQIISNTPAAVAAFRDWMASGRHRENGTELDTETFGHIRRKPHQNLVEASPHPLQVRLDSFPDDETNIHECVITFHNSLPLSRPFSDYRGGCILIRLLPGNRIEVEIEGLSTGVTAHVPTKATPLAPPVEACWVRATGGAFLVLDDHVAGFVDYSWLHPGVVSLAEGIAEGFGQTVQWIEDIDGLADELRQLSVESGISEHDILQELLKGGRLQRRR